MSGHSKWATIKHKKGALDAKRGKIFTRLLKEIAVAAKGGGNPDSNARLRTAILAAKSENMPQENIKRAIQRGTGELEGVNYEEITFEGYGPGGVAVIVETLTDNRNRTVSEIRHAFSKNGGNLGSTGSVSFQFKKMGVFRLDPATVRDQDELELDLIDHGLEEMGESSGEKGETQLVIRCAFNEFGNLQEALEKRGLAPLSAEHEYICSVPTELPEEQAAEVLALIDKLEQDDDVQKVFHTLA